MPSGFRAFGVLVATAIALSACIPQVGGGNRPASPAAVPEPATLPPAPAPAAVQPAPGWIAAPVAADARSIADSSTVVRPGETIRSIGNRTGAGSEAIARANGLTAPFVVRAGQRLKVPGGRYHLVRLGQTGVAIARAYGIPWSDIATRNDLQPPYILRTGQRLALPSPAQVARMSIEERARAFELDIDDLATGSEPAIARDAAAPRAGSKPAPPNRPVIEPQRFAGRFDWPLHGAILQRFGPAGGGKRNDGINIAAERGEPVRAAADGVVAYAGTAIAVYGGLVLLKHGGGWITAYGHAEQILVARGQVVKRGDVIARAGATGSVARPQLHFEIREKRMPVDPLRQLPAVVGAP